MTANCLPKELQEHPLFRSLSDADLMLLSSQSARFDAPIKTDLISAGSAPRQSLITLHAGWAITYLPLPDGSRQILDFAIPGDCLGLEPFLLGRANSAARSITRVSACAIEGQTARALIDVRSDLSASLLRQLAVEQARIGRRLAALAKRKAAQRIGYLMLEIMQRLVQRGLADGRSCPFPLQRRHVGDALGISRNHVKRSLEFLRAQDLASIARRRLTIHDPERLAAFVAMPILDRGDV